MSLKWWKRVRIALGINLGAYTASAIVADINPSEPLPLWFVVWAAMSILVCLVLWTVPIKKDK